MYVNFQQYYLYINFFILLQKKKNMIEKVHQVLPSRCLRCEI